MSLPENSHYNSSTDSTSANCSSEEIPDIYSLDDLIETLEEVASHLIISSQ
jgi:hypothetical protein